MSDVIAVASFIKKRWLYLFLAGGAAALALPPFYFIPFLLMAFPTLFICMELSQNGKEAFKAGWWFGMGYWVVGIYWITFSILTEAETFWWAVPFAVILLSAVLALYVALATYLTYKLPRDRWQKVLFLGCLWVLGEMARTYFDNVFTLFGFPWNLLGYVWTATTETMQLASVIGTFGLSLLTVLLALSLALSVRVVKKEENYVFEYAYFKEIVSGVIIVAIALFGYGFYRITHTKLYIHDDMKVRLVQANVAEHHRWDTAKRMALVEKHVQLSQAPGAEDMQAIIWSESSVPFMIEDEELVQEKIKQAIPEYGILLTGSMRYGKDEEGNVIPDALYSTIHAVDKDMKVLGVYDKYRLVPFGEYVPFRSFLPMDSIVGGGDFGAGSGPETIITRRVFAYSPLICYDAIFPQSVVNDEFGPEWMLNVTNDAWFEKRFYYNDDDFIQLSSGPYQHFSMVRMRAVEQGIPMIRVANTGISANISPIGHIQGRIGLGEEGILDTRLFGKLQDGTVYSRFGDIFVLLFMYICGLFILSKQRLGWFGA